MFSTDALAGKSKVPESNIILLVKGLEKCGEWTCIPKRHKFFKASQILFKNSDMNGF